MLSDDMDEFAFADTDTFEGQLQPGRGIAEQRARDEPGAAEAVCLCITADSRWDRQTEDRGAYLARLVRDLDLGLDPLRDHLARADADESAPVGLALDVLAPMDPRDRSRRCSGLADWPGHRPSNRFKRASAVCLAGWCLPCWPGPLSG